MSEQGSMRAEVLALATAARGFALAVDRHTAAVAGAHGLDPTGLVALGIVLERDERGTKTGPGDLRRDLGLTSAATTALVDRLVASEHLERRPDPLDRRRVELVLRPKALQDGQRMFMPLVRAMAADLVDVGEDDLTTALRVLERMTTSTERAAAGG